MRSEARARLARMTEEQGMDGMLRLNTYEGADPPPGPNRLLLVRRNRRTPVPGIQKRGVA
jgi:hypothetical protein